MTLKWMTLLLQSMENPGKMENIKFPEFLNTEDKWNAEVRRVSTVNQFEDFFYTLLEDPEISTGDILKIMKRFERDVVLVHGNKDIYCVMDVVDSIIWYMITSALAQEQSVATYKLAEEKVKKKAKKESEEWVVDKSTETTKEHQCCRSDCMRKASEKEE